MKPPPIACGCVLGTPLQHAWETEPFPVVQSVNRACISDGEQVVCGPPQLLQLPATIGAPELSHVPGLLDFPPA